jgi:hypothetical protein
MLKSFCSFIEDWWVAFAGIGIIGSAIVIVVMVSANIDEERKEKNDILVNTCIERAKVSDKAQEESLIFDLCMRTQGKLPYSQDVEKGE